MQEGRSLPHSPDAIRPPTECDRCVSYLIPSPLPVGRRNARRSFEGHSPYPAGSSMEMTADRSPCHSPDPTMAGTECPLPAADAIRPLLGVAVG